MRSRKKSSTKRRWRFRKPWRFGLVFLILVGGPGWFLFFHPFWRVREVTVEGNELFSKEAILSVAQVPLARSTFLIRFHDISRRLVRVPGIHAVSLQRKFPNRVVIHVRERKPYALGLVGTKTLVFDEEGVLLNGVASSLLTPRFTSLSDLPVITLPKSAVHAPILKQTLTLIVMVRHIFPTARLHVTLDPFNQLSLLVEDVALIKLGTFDDYLDDRLAILHQFAQQLQSRWRNIEYLDLRSIHYPALKFIS